MAETQVQHDAGAPSDVETRSRRQDFQRVFFSNRLAVFGTVVISVFILMAVFAPWIAPYDPLEQNLGRQVRRAERGAPHRARTSWGGTSSRA